MKFKTNARCEGCKATILKHMETNYPNMKWTMDLDNTDKVLECHGIPDNAALAAQIEKAIAETGFNGAWLPSDSI